jgi:hypothetical protein
LFVIPSAVTNLPGFETQKKEGFLTRRSGFGMTIILFFPRHVPLAHFSPEYLQTPQAEVENPGPAGSCASNSERKSQAFCEGLQYNVRLQQGCQAA